MQLHELKWEPFPQHNIWVEVASISLIGNRVWRNAAGRYYFEYMPYGWPDGFDALEAQCILYEVLRR